LPKRSLVMFGFRNANWRDAEEIPRSAERGVAGPNGANCTRNLARGQVPGERIA